MVDLFLKNGLIVTEDRIIKGNLAIKGEKIAGILSPGFEVEARAVIDLEGKIVTPGCIDPHVHIPIGKDTHRGDFFTEGKAALFGGTTTVIDFVEGAEGELVPSFNHIKKTLDSISPLDYSLHAVIMHEKDLEDIETLHKAGIVSFKHIMADCNGLTGMHTGFQLFSFKEISRVGSSATVHAENEEIQAYIIKKLRQSNRCDPLAHAESRTVLSEVEAISRAILLGRETQAHLHVFHVSSAQGAAQIEKAKQQGIAVTGETCPHYLYFTREDVAEKGPYLQINPSIKFKEDREGLWKSIQNGVLDMVTSDHYAPLANEKEEGWENCWSIEAGVPGIETRSLLLISEGVQKGRLGWEKFSEITATKPAKIFGLYPKKGVICPGADADLVVWDTQKEKTITPEKLHHTADWTPYAGLNLKGLPERVYLRGRLVIEGEKFLGKKGTGSFIPGKGYRRRDS